MNPRRRIDAELELTVDDGFTLIAVGDVVISRPISKQPAFAAVMELLRGSDAVYGNFETVLVDFDRFTGAPYAWQEDWPLSCEPAAAADLKAIGFDLLSRANNHALDWGPEGMRETSRILDEQGLTHAGTGETLALARRARFCETPKGRVGLVSCVTTFRETMDALDPVRRRAGQAGCQRTSAPARRSRSGEANLRAPGSDQLRVWQRLSTSRDTAWATIVASLDL